MEMLRAVRVQWAWGWISAASGGWGWDKRTMVVKVSGEISGQVFPRVSKNKFLTFYCCHGALLQPGSTAPAAFCSAVSSSQRTSRSSAMGRSRTRGELPVGKCHQHNGHGENRLGGSTSQGSEPESDLEFQARGGNFERFTLPNLSLPHPLSLCTKGQRVEFSSEMYYLPCLFVQNLPPVSCRHSACAAEKYCSSNEPKTVISQRDEMNFANNKSQPE